MGQRTSAICVRTIPRVWRGKQVAESEFLTASRACVACFVGFAPSAWPGLPPCFHLGLLLGPAAFAFHIVPFAVAVLLPFAILVTAVEIAFRPGVETSV